MYKFSILQITGALLLVAAYLSGGASLFWNADHTHIGKVIILLTLYGIWMVSRNDFKGATWLSEKLPLLGLLGTVLGLLLASQSVSMDNLDEARVTIFLATCKALSTNFLGMLGMLWVTLSIRAAGHE